MSETWLINEVPTIEPLTLDENIQIYNANFISNGITFKNIGLSNEMVPGKPTNLANIIYDTGLSTTTPAYNSGRWENEAYRTIEFENEPTGDLLTWLQANGTKQATPVTKQQIDLSTLSGWANLSDGEHSITVKAKANGYADSAASNAVSVEKVASGYTVNISTDYVGTSDFHAVAYINGSTTPTNLTNKAMTTLANVNKIKFAITDVVTRATYSISSTKLGLNLEASSGNDATSQEFTLTQDIDDLIISEV